MTDYLMDSTYDLQLENGDFVRGESTNQHQTNLLLSEKGAYKQNPLVGVGVMTFLKDESLEDLLREIRLQFSKDGMQVQKIGFNPAGKLELIAPYA